MRIILYIIAIITMGFAKTSLLAEYVYTHREYIAEKTSNITYFARDILIVLPLGPDNLSFDFTNVSRENMVKDAQKIISSFEIFVDRINRHPSDLHYRISDSVATGVLIRLLQLDYSKYAKSVEKAAKLLESDTYIPALNEQRNLLITSIAQSGLSDKKKANLLSYVELPDSLKSEIVNDTLLQQATRFRISKSDKVVDSLIGIYDKLLALNSASAGKQIYYDTLCTITKTIVGIGTQKALRFGVSVFNDSVYSMNNNCISQTIKHIVLMEFSRWYNTPLLQRELLEILEDPAKTAEPDRWQPAYINACNQWFMKEFGITPKVDISKTIPIIIGNCKVVG